MKPNAIMLALLPVFAASNGFAADETETLDSRVELIKDLGEVVVRGETFANKMGTQRVREEDIARRPGTNGNLTELLKNNPNVQFSNTAGNSRSGGEIRPDEVSFHGEKYYNNNFTIDGISNNDNLNPGSNNYTQKTPLGANPWDLPAGGTQSFWIDSSLVKNVEVFDSNISAKYGNFTGGLVNAELKSGYAKSSGKIFYRTTRDEWADFHIAEKDREDFIQTASVYDQPQFRKQQYGVMINQPINEKAAVLFSYNKTDSKIPYTFGALRDAGQDKAVWGKNLYSTNQRRSSETFLLRGSYHADSGDVVKATAMYSPHKSKYTLPNNIDGLYTAKGGGLRFDADWERDLSWANMKSQIAYRKTGDNMKYDADTYRIYRRSAGIPYRANGATVTNGGYGEFETEKSTVTLKQDYNLNAFETGAVKHRIGFGWQFDKADAKYKRSSEANLYNYTASNRVECGDANECIGGEQYAARWTHYPTRNVKVDDSTYSLYIQDNMSWKNLSINAGLRFDRNSFLGNNNIAPRLAVAYDVFGDTSTRLFGGLNRYYSASMLAYKLRQEIGNNHVYTRKLNGKTLSDWTYDSSGVGGTVRYDVSNLKTPYSDEAVLGVTQKMFDSIWTLKWVHRNGKDQLTRVRRSETDSTRILTNDGWSKNNTFTLAVSPTGKLAWKYAEIDWNVGVQVQRTKTNNSYYDDTATDVAEKAIYNNQLLDTQSLPAADFNAPWKAFVSLNTYFPRLRLHWDQRFSWTASRKYRYAAGDVSCTSSRYSAVCGDYNGTAALYKDAALGSALFVDWRFAYKQPMPFGHELEVTADINNVFNKKQPVVSSGTSYKMGRNYWLGVSYKW
ncbi:TonB-dependent receptor plug domain-containing protein [Neisseria iguanae]|uniref:TonB-dependent receptor n=1 Tax=Neisseria iguanae TaxID=90242 RepID=A0A2P7TZQ1_9NEIS|nr:TonB-dependent receptor plug domain-containing protein [Neisseria iguanae]PSJ80187.1 TonB-dependent receptor [Neisseria iguanae]